MLVTSGNVALNKSEYIAVGRKVWQAFSILFGERFSTFWNIPQIFLHLPYSRKLEEEADEVGMKMAAKVKVWICHSLFRTKQFDCRL